MTERLFWGDPDLCEFEARVVEVADGGARLLLESTAFYPESGGQPCDLGTIDGENVVDVQEEGEDIWHTVEGGTFTVGDTVSGAIDVARRRDHSVQHTAQHIVSALALKLFGAKTVGFHMSEDYTTVDLETGDLSRDQRAILELEANRAVEADLPVSAAVEVIEEGMDIRVRRPPTPGQERRLVSVGDLDRCQCCGTHVTHSAHIGLIKLGKVERVRKKTRLEILAGRRVVARLGRYMDVVDNLSSMTSAGMDELVDFITAAQQTARSLKHRNGELIVRLAGYEARELLSSAIVSDGRKLVKVSLPDREPGDLKALAAELVSRDGVVALLGTVFEGSPALVFARAEDVDLDVSVLLKKSLALLGGKGGGRPMLAQGGGGDPTKLEDALDAAKLDEIKAGQTI